MKSEEREGYRSALTKYYLENSILWFTYVINNKLDFVTTKRGTIVIFVMKILNNLHNEGIRTVSGLRLTFTRQAVPRHTR